MAKTTMYILVGEMPVPCSNVLDWGKWMENANRVVRRTTREGKTVSTVFLGLDHGFGSDVPVLFETMVFSNDKWDQHQVRYCTYDEAVRGHVQVCDEVYANTFHSKVLPEPKI